MICKTLDRANKRLAQQHEEIKGLEATISEHGDNLYTCRTDSFKILKVSQAKDKEIVTLRARIDEQEEEEIEELRRQDVALRCTVNRQQKELQELTRENRMRSSESAKWRDERQAVASDALRWLDERDETRKENVTLRANLDTANWELDNGRAELATAVAKTNGLRKIVAKCYTFFAAFPRRERDEETHARIQDTVEDLFLVCRAAIGIDDTEEAD